MLSVDCFRFKILITSMALTFVILRAWLYFSPNSDLDLLGYNIHHLFTGIFLIAAGGIPLAILSGEGKALDLAAAVFGIGLGLALDEWVYLIVTDGTNTSYLLPVSFWGGALLVAGACIYAGALYLWFRK